MATIKVKFRPAADPQMPGRVYYQVIHRREVRRIASDVCARPGEWSMDDVCICRDLALLERVVRCLERRGREYSAQDVARMFGERRAAPSFLDFMQKEISRKTRLGKDGTADNYRAARRSFSKFLGERDVAAEDMCGELMESYQAWLSARGISNNSVSFYMRILRCVYNHAVKKRLTADRKPFDDVYTGIDKTRKRAIAEAEMKRVKNLDLGAMPRLERARDLFILSFYCMGISFVDLATLKKTDVTDGRLTYRRAKTGQMISVALNRKMTSLFEKYASDRESPYLLDIVRRPAAAVRRQYQNELNRVNRYLKRVGKLAGLRTPLTTYVSRHSWASIARSKNIRLSTISDALGHDNESTTQIYLASIDTGGVDRANEIILKGL